MRLVHAKWITRNRRSPDQSLTLLITSCCVHQIFMHARLMDLHVLRVKPPKRAYLIRSGVSCESNQFGFWKVQMIYMKKKQGIGFAEDENLQLGLGTYFIIRFYSGSGVRPRTCPVSTRQRQAPGGDSSQGGCCSNARPGASGGGQRAGLQGATQQQP